MDIVINIIQAVPGFLWGIVLWLNDVPDGVWYAILGSGFWSGLLYTIKIFLKRRWDKAPSEVKMFFTNAFGLLVIAATAYISMTPDVDPLLAIGGLFGLTTLLQQPFFFKVVKPKVIQAWENYDQAAALKEEMRTAAIEGQTPLER